MKAQRKNLLYSVIVAALMFSVLMLSTACTGAGQATAEQVQVTFGEHQVSFATLYDAMAWLNGRESDGSQNADAAGKEPVNGGRGNFGYLWNWEEKKGLSTGTYTQGTQPQGQFQITILVQSGVESAPQYGVSNDGTAISNGVKTLLAMDNPHADVTMATRNDFNLNLTPSGAADNTNLTVGYAKFTLDAMKLSSSHNFFMKGNDITIGTNFSNSGALNVYSGAQSGDVTAPSGTNYTDGTAELVVKSAQASLTTVSGGNMAGSFTGESEITVKDAKRIQNLLGAGSFSGTSTHYGHIAINVDGGRITSLAGVGKADMGPNDAVTVNMTGGTVANLAGGGFDNSKVAANNVTVNLTGGSVTGGIYGTQRQSAAGGNSRYGNVAVNIIPAAGKTLALPELVVGNVSAEVDVVDIIVNTTAGTADVSTVKNWYIGAQAAPLNNASLPNTTLTVNAPGGNFKNVYLYGAGNMMGNAPAVAIIENAASFQNLYGFAKEVTGGGERRANITFGTTDGAGLSVNIAERLNGFSQLTLNNISMTVGKTIWPDSSRADNTTVGSLVGIYESTAGDLYLNNSTLETPGVNRAGTAIFHTVTGTGNSVISGRAGNSAGATTPAGEADLTINSVSTKPGIFVTASFDQSIKVGVSANAPTVKSATEDGTFIANNLRPMIWYGTADKRGTMPEAANPMYRVFHPTLAINVGDQYTFIGLMDTGFIRVTNDDSGQSDTFENLSLAYQAIQNNIQGNSSVLGGKASGYTITFRAPYTITQADWQKASDVAKAVPALAVKDADKSGAIMLTYTSYDGVAHANQSAPAGTNMVTFGQNTAIPEVNNATTGIAVLLPTNTTFENIRLAGVQELYCNGLKTVIDGGVEYYTKDGSTKQYIYLYGATKDKKYLAWVNGTAAYPGGPAAGENTHTDVTINSGSYKGVAGGYRLPACWASGSIPTHDAGYTYNLTVHGGDFSGGNAQTTLRAELGNLADSVMQAGDGNIYDISYYSYERTKARSSYISAAYGQMYDSGGPAEFAYGASGADLVIKDERIPGTDQMYSLTAPAAVTGVYTSTELTYGRLAYGGSLEAENRLINMPTITINTQQAVQFGAIAGESVETQVGDVDYRNMQYYGTFKIDINAPNATISQLVGQRFYNVPPKSEQRVEINLENIKYIDTVTAAENTYINAAALENDYASINVTGDVTVGSMNSFTMLTLDGEAATLNVASAHPTKAPLNYQMYKGVTGSLSANGNQVIAANNPYGNLVMKGGATLNLHGSTVYHRVNRLNVEGMGNVLNVNGNQGAYNTSNGSALGVLNVSNGTNLTDNDGHQLILGLTDGSTFADKLNVTGDRAVNIIGVYGASKLGVASGTAGGYWDVKEIGGSTETSRHFVAGDNAYQVRSDAYKQYTIGSGGIVLELETFSPTNYATGFIYLGRAATDNTINLVRVSPAPDADDDAYKWYPTLADAARAIKADAHDERTDYTITFLSSYIVTSADEMAVAALRAEDTAKLTFSGEYYVPDDYKDSAVYHVPAQKQATLSMGGSNFALQAQDALFETLFVTDNGLSFTKGVNVTAAQDVKLVAADKKAGDYASMPGTGDPLVNFPGGNTYHAVTGAVPNGEGNRPTFYVDQKGIVWHVSTDGEKELTESVNQWNKNNSANKVKHLYTVDSIEVEGERIYLTQTSEIMAKQLESNDLPFRNVSGVTGVFEVLGNRTVVVSGGMNSPEATVKVPATLSMRPTGTDRFEHFVYAVNELGASAILVPKDDKGTNPIAVGGNMPGSDYRLGITIYGKKVYAAPGDDLLTGGAIAAMGADQTKYVELNDKLGHIPVVVTDGLVELDPAAAGIRASDFWIERGDVYLDPPEAKQYNDAVITDSEHAGAVYYADGGMLTEGAVVVADEDTTLTDKASADPYKVKISFPGQADNNTTIVGGTVFDTIVSGPCHTMGANGFTIGLAQLLDLNQADQTAGNQIKLGTQVLLDSNATLRDKVTGDTVRLTEINDVTRITYEPFNSENDATRLDQITVDNGQNYVGETFKVTIEYQCQQGEQHIVTIGVTVEMTEEAGVYAGNFKIKADEVYVAGSKNYNESRIIELAYAYGVGADGKRTTEGLTILPKGSTGTDDAGNTYTVDLIASTGTYQVVFRFVDGEKTYTRMVRAEVVDNQTTEPDPKELVIDGPASLAQGENQFTAKDPVTGEKVVDVTWGVTATDPSGNPISGITIDENGKLTMPDPSTIPEGTKVVITATPKEGTEAADKYMPGSETYLFGTGGENKPEPGPNTEITANNFEIGLNELAGKTEDELKELVKLYSGVSATRVRPEPEDIDPVLISVTDLGGLSSASKKGETKTITFMVKGEDGSDVITTATATVVDYSVIDPTADIRMSANDFEYAKDMVFNEDGTPKANAESMIIMLAQAKASKLSDGAHLTVSVRENGLKAQPGTYPVKFTASNIGEAKYLTTHGSYRDGGVVDPTEPVDPSEPEPDYGNDILITANDFVYGDELFKADGTLDTDKVDAWAIMLAQATAKRVSDGVGQQFLRVEYPSALDKSGKDRTVTFVAMGANAEASYSVTARYLSSSVVDPTEPVDPADPEPDYKGDIQLYAKDFTVTVKELAASTTSGAFKTMITEKAGAAAKTVSSGDPLSVLVYEDKATINGDVYTTTLERSSRPGQYTVVFTAKNPVTGVSEYVVVKATVVENEAAGLHANDFSIAKDEVYKSGTTDYNVNRLIALAKAHMSDGNGNIMADAVITVADSWTDPVTNTTHTTDLIDAKGTYTVVFQSGAAHVAVKATVSDGQVIAPDPSGLVVEPGEGGVKEGGDTQFTAKDPVTGATVPEVTWSVTVTDKNGEEKTIESITIDENGKLTIPEGVLEEGDRVIVTATPEDKDKYKPGEYVYVADGNGGGSTEAQPEAGIRANDFEIGVNALLGKDEAAIHALVRQYAGAYAWVKDTAPEEALTDITVSTKLSAASKKGDAENVTFLVTHNEKQVEVTVKATVVGYSIIDPTADIRMSVNDFEYSDELFNEDGSQAANAGAMAIMLAQAKANRISDGAHLTVKITNAELAKLLQQAGSYPVTFTATNPGKAAPNTASISASGSYRDSGAVNPIEPVDPADPKPDYGNDVQISANDFVYGDQLFENGALVSNVDEWAKMLAQAKAKQVSSGKLVEISRVEYTPGSLDQSGDPFAVTFFAVGVKGEEISVTVKATYVPGTVVDPTEPVNPTPEEPEPDYGNDLQLSAMDFAVTLTEVKSWSEAQFNSMLIARAQAVAKQVSSGDPVTVSIKSSGLVYQRDASAYKTGQFRIVFEATGSDNMVLEVPVIATVTDGTAAGLYASNFTIEAVDVYADPEAKSYDEAKIKHAAGVYLQDELGQKLTDLYGTIQIEREQVTIDGQSYQTNLADAKGTYTVVFKAPIPGKTGEFYYKAVEAIVVDNKVVGDGEALEIIVPELPIREEGKDLVSDPFQAVDPVTKEPVEGVIWGATNKDGNPIDGVTIDEDGKLTIGKDVPAGTEIIVTATPPEGSGYDSSTVTITVPEINKKPDVSEKDRIEITANNTVIGREQLSGFVYSETVALNTLKTYMSVKAVLRDSKLDISDTITIVDGLDRLRQAVTDKTITEVEITFQAEYKGTIAVYSRTVTVKPSVEVADHGVEGNGIILTAYDFEVSRKDLAAITAEEVVALARAKAVLTKDGSALPVAVSDATMATLHAAADTTAKTVSVTLTATNPELGRGVELNSVVATITDDERYVKIDIDDSMGVHTEDEKGIVILQSVADGSSADIVYNIFDNVQMNDADKVDSYEGVHWAIGLAGGFEEFEDAASGMFDAFQTAKENTLNTEDTNYTPNANTKTATAAKSGVYRVYIYTGELDLRDEVAVKAAIVAGTCDYVYVVVPGDVNKSGNISGSDSALTDEMWAKFESAQPVPGGVDFLFELADVNGSGSISGSDSALIDEMWINS